MNVIILFILTACFCYGSSGKYVNALRRRKREAGGALDIVTNHALPIHADVNVDAPVGYSEKPCPKHGVSPSEIEPGTVFQVTPPRDTVYEIKSLRKSFPMTTQLDLVRGISRLVTLLVIAFTAAVEFYPVVVNAFNSIYEFLYFNKY